MERFAFPAWTNTIKPLIGAGVVGGALYVVGLVWFGFSPKTTDIGYAPKQPVPYSHALHVGQLGLDCRYCHTTVEKTNFAAVPPMQTCMNCHEQRVKTQSAALQPLREAWRKSEPLQWTKVHRLPDYVYFDHSAHVTRGVSCVSCHGRVDKMEVVTQVKELSMGWCLDCHRNPEPNLRPPEFVTALDWKPDPKDPSQSGEALRKQFHINPSQDCSTCHR
jgi:hypothetical protein